MYRKLKYKALFYDLEPFLLFIATALFLLGVVVSCSKKDELPPQAPEGQRLTAVELNSKVGFALAGDNVFQPVTREQILASHEEMKSELFRKGLVRWDERFDCNRFVSYQVSLLQVQHFLRNFHASASARAQALAVGQVWYKPDAVPANSGARHAILEGVTPEGIVHFDSTTGKFVNLSAAEKQSIFARLYY